MFIGYCRVSTKAQAQDGNGLEAQKKEILAKYPDAKIYVEAYTGVTTERPEFQKIINEMQEGDTLVVAKLDRLARNTVEGIEIVQSLFEKRCSVHALNVGLLEDTSMGHFFLTTLLAVAELERTQILERTQAGKNVARKKEGYREGRPRKFDDDQIVYALELLERLPYSKVVKMTGISKSTLARAKKRKKFEKNVEVIV